MKRKPSVRNTGITEVMAIKPRVNHGLGRKMGSVAMPQESLQERALKLHVQYRENISREPRAVCNP